jgi:hypothetical protein
MNRTIFLVDGFNLYHSLIDAQRDSGGYHVQAFIPIQVDFLRISIQENKRRISQDCSRVFFNYLNFARTSAFQSYFVNKHSVQVIFCTTFPFNPTGYEGILQKR